MAMAMLAVLLAAATVTLPAPVSGDFDRDGVVDVATIVQRGDGYALVVRPGAAGRAEASVATFTAANAAHLYLAKAAPGVEATACAKGAGPAACVRKSVTVTGDVLDFGTPEASRAVALWNGKAFEVVWLAD
jgi:hypothetical protein